MTPHTPAPGGTGARPRTSSPDPGGTAAPGSVPALGEAILAGRYGPDPDGMTVTSAFWLHHTTRLAGGPTTYANHYALLRVGTAFGACSFEHGELFHRYCADTSGRTVADVLSDAPLPVRVAAMDAYLSHVRPHRDSGAEPVALPAGTPEQRARARDEAVAGLLPSAPGRRVALIGVVEPLVAAVEARGATCLPCDFNLDATRWGTPVASDMDEVLDRADAVVATGMTLGNGTFDRILAHCRDRELPLIVYAQTGSAVARAFLGSGVTALSAEPFPFSQFSADETTLYRYRAGTAAEAAA
ncbi:hypothetical protein HDA36_003367 [Nocardiopsis composta]|uniref:Putative heavy-metal chelation domain-containing protein n=2 Tax=Nocardiopsis composta TaxID=157465 RepID=A0A7W8VEP0_9ACTN|nr:hypothetical protein [Nocardiopsis composta]